jgi:MFS family permease
MTQGSLPAARQELLDAPPPGNGQSGGHTVAEVYGIIGWNRYHTLLFIFCGLGWLADAVETGLLSLLKSEASKEWTDVSDFGLTMLQTMVFIGELLGCMVWGPMADRYGRRPAFFLSNLGLVVFGALSAVAWNFWALVVFRTLCGVCITGITVAFDCLVECVSESKASAVGLAIEMFWTLGTIYVNLMGAVILPASFGSYQPWRVLCLMCTIPIVFACLGVLVLEESPMWLLEMGRDEEAMESLRRIAKKGGKDLSGISLLPYRHEEESSMKDVVRGPYLRRSICFAIIWAGALLGYYGASLATPLIFQDGGADDSVDYGQLLFSSCGEFLGIIVIYFLVQRCGYVKAMFAAFVFAVIFTLAIMLRPVVDINVLAIFTFFCRAAVMATTASMYVATPLAYPTRIRCSAHAFCNIFGRLGGIAATIFESMGFNVQLAVYAAANAVCALVIAVQGKHLEQYEEIFQVLMEDQSHVHTSMMKSRVSRLSAASKRPSTAPLADAVA